MRLRAQLHDPLARPRRTGERDLVDQRVGGDRFADHRPETGDQVEDALRQSRLVDDLGQDEGVDRGDFARLQDDRASRGQGRCDLERDLVQGEVPRSDGADDTDWLFDDERVADLVLPDIRRRPGRVVGELSGGQSDLEHLGEVARHPDFVADHVGDLAGAGLEPLGDLLEERAAVLGRRRRPARESAMGRLDRSVDVGWRPRRDGCEHLLGGRVDDLERLGPRRRNPRSIDVKGITNVHGYTSFLTAS